VLWRENQAIIHGPADRLQGLLRAVVEFTYYEAQLSKLEEEVEADWAIAEGHTIFAHEQHHPNPAQYKQIGEMTQRVQERRMRYARIERRLYTPSDELPTAAYKAGLRLRDEEDIEARLEDADQKIEVYQDLYEAINQRVGEERHFRSELFMEIVIAALLAVEILAVVWEIHMMYKGD
jgi:hypothetical protein